MADRDLARLHPGAGKGAVVLGGALVVIAIVVSSGSTATLDTRILDRTHLPSESVGNQLAQEVNQASGVAIAVRARSPRLRSRSSGAIGRG